MCILMPRPRNKSKLPKDVSGRYANTNAPRTHPDHPQSPPIELDDGHMQQSAVSEDPVLISDSDESSDNDWSLLPLPLTIGEQLQQYKAMRDAEKEVQQQQQAVVHKRECNSQIWSVEHCLDGQIDNRTGVKHGAYLIGGLSKCTTQNKKIKIQ
jgi:hypothetical protein